MEMQYFVKPGTDLELFEFWRHERMNVGAGLGVRPEKLAVHQHTKDELAALRKVPHDIQYDFPSAGRNSRGSTTARNFDLSRHQDSRARSSSIYGCRDERAIHSVRGRNVGGRRPHDARGDVDAYTREE